MRNNSIPILFKISSACLERQILALFCWISFKNCMCFYLESSKAISFNGKHWTEWSGKKIFYFNKFLPFRSFKYPSRVFRFVKPPRNALLWHLKMFHLAPSPSSLPNSRISRKNESKVENVFFFIPIEMAQEMIRRNNNTLSF